jgi:hypothetical protein
MILCVAQRQKDDLAEEEVSGRETGHSTPLRLRLRSLGQGRTPLCVTRAQMM